MNNWLALSNDKVSPRECRSTLLGLGPLREVVRNTAFSRAVAFYGR